MIYVRPDAQSLFDEQAVADFLAIPCDVVRRFKNRCTGRFVRSGRAFYIKVHHPGGWWPVAEDLLRLRWPQVGARGEWLALEELRRHGIDAPRVIAYGEEGSTPASQRSFLITEEIAPTISLETLAQRTENWHNARGFKRRLIRSLATIARTLHSNGINHRDFYLCHFLLDATPVACGLDSQSTERATVDGYSSLPLLNGSAKPRLHLIDLHRAQKRSRTPRRWMVKDLGGLLFSAMDVDLSARDLALFVRCYSRTSTRAGFRGNRRFWHAIRQRAAKLYQKTHHRRPKLDLARFAE